MNVAFTKFLKIRNLLREVNFRRLPAATETYHVDTTDERGMRLMFFMTRSEEGSWKLSSTSLPAWIVEAEGVLSKAIEEGEAKVEEDRRRTA